MTCVREVADAKRFAHESLPQGTIHQIAETPACEFAYAYKCVRRAFEMPANYCKL